MQLKLEIRILYLFIFIALLPEQVSAQEEVVKNQGSPILDWVLHNIVLLSAGVIILVVLGLLWNVMNLIMNNYQEVIAKEQGLNIEKKSLEQKVSIWKQISDKAWNLIPIERESDIDLGHDYDGIKELDNKLPPWWLYLFYGTIIWGIGYAYVSHFSDYGESQIEQYERQVELAAIAQSEYLSKLANAVDETNVTLLTDAKSLEEGKNIFLSLCAVCHGQGGEGGVGPNFADRYWVHGGDIKDLFKTIKYGVPEKGMISWKSQLSPAVMQTTASYILTLVGTDPPNQKAPEGDLYEREAAPSDGDAPPEDTPTVN